MEIQLVWCSHVVDREAPRKRRKPRLRNKSFWRLWFWTSVSRHVDCQPVMKHETLETFPYRGNFSFRIIRVFDWAPRAYSWIWYRDRNSTSDSDVYIIVFQADSSSDGRHTHLNTSTFQRNFLRKTRIVMMKSKLITWLWPITKQTLR